METTTLHTLAKMKQQGEKIACLTSYDATFTVHLNQAGLDIILVGDSLGMVLQGKDSTLPVSISDMEYHTRCVKAGNSHCMIMADMPFMTYRTPEQAMHNATCLMQAGAHIVKLEGSRWLADAVTQLAQQGIPVCAHLGLTPQTINQLGGYRVQGKSERDAKILIEDAKLLEQAGSSMILLECVPSDIAKAITQQVDIPVIGIGAGVHTDAQVLVLHDLLGLHTGKTPRFVKNYMQQENTIQDALAAYVKEVKEQTFPGPQHSFT